MRIADKAHVVRAHLIVRQVKGQGTVGVSFRNARRPVEHCGEIHVQSVGSMEESTTQFGQEGRSIRGVERVPLNAECQEVPAEVIDTLPDEIT